MGVTVQKSGTFHRECDFLIPNFVILITPSKIRHCLYLISSCLSPRSSTGHGSSPPFLRWRRRYFSSISSAFRSITMPPMKASPSTPESPRPMNGDRPPGGRRPIQLSPKACSAPLGFGPAIFFRDGNRTEL